mmetsp:Transcript_166349/g.404209  ORF Transcript_166349/g.404209 Transcript_166349/m.404209 type:complete len:237 (-) Transcript_166349:404-1114(-)
MLPVVLPGRRFAGNAGGGLGFSSSMLMSCMESSGNIVDSSREASWLCFLGLGCTGELWNGSSFSPELWLSAKLKQPSSSTFKYAGGSSGPSALAPPKLTRLSASAGSERAREAALLAVPPDCPEMAPWTMSCALLLAKSSASSESCTWPEREPSRADLSRASLAFALAASRRSSLSPSSLMAAFKEPSKSAFRRASLAFSRSSASAFFAFASSSMASKVPSLLALSKLPLTRSLAS